MVKKIKVLGLVAIMLVLVACNNGNEYVIGDGSDMTVTETPVSGLDTDSRAEDKRAVPDNLPHLVWGTNNLYVVLIDALTGDELAEFSVERGQHIWNFFDFGNDYFGILVGNIVDDDVNWEINEDADDKPALSSSEDVTHEEEEWRYLVLDSQLNVVKELLITDENLQSLNGHFTTYVVYDAGELIVYYLTFLEPQRIYRYHQQTGETTVFHEVDDDRLFFTNIHVMNSGHIAFRAGRTGEEDHVHYDFMDLASHEITIFSEGNFRAIAEINGMIVSGATLLINEEFSAPTMGGGNVLSVDRGEVLVANVETGSHYVVQLEGMESVWASLSLDGQHVVTVDESGNYFRKYEMSGNLVSEIRLTETISTGWQLDIIPISANRYIIYSNDRMGTHQTVMIEVN